MPSSACCSAKPASGLACGSGDRRIPSAGESLPAISDAWGWNGLSKSPPSAPTPDQSLISPLLHYAPNDGLTWTSVFTIDSGSNDLQETYLPAIGSSWSTQDLSAENPPGTPPW
ncbi:MAG TPA: hypothetical protein VMU95_28160 [Trebonia sp.]|nr:hypothetical protein [Trebonia sp.]